MLLAPCACSRRCCCRTFTLELTSLFLPFALLALSLDLLWGENRLVSFGHGAFFAAGGYIGGLVLIGKPYDVSGAAASFLNEGSESRSLERAPSHTSTTSDRRASRCSAWCCRRCSAAWPA